MTGEDILRLYFEAAVLGLFSGMLLGAIKSFFHNMVS